MPALIILGALALLIALLLFLPAGLRLRWADDRLTLKAFYGPLRLNLSPDRLARRAERRAAKAEKRRKKPKTPKAKKQKPEKQAPEGTKKDKLSFHGVLALLRPAGRVLRKLLRRVKVRKLWVEGRVSASDAHRTAMHYAALCAAAPALLDVLGALFDVKKPSVSLQPDFTAFESRWTLSVRVSLRPVYLLAAAWRLLMLYLKRPKQPARTRKPAQQKGGKQHEPTASHQ